MSSNIHAIKDIEKVVTGIDGEIKNVDITRLTAPGENYLSLVLRVDFQVEKNGQSKTVHAVAKRLPVGNPDFDMNGFAMKNEITWYSEILPKIKEFGKEFGIDMDFYPEYFGGRLSLDPSNTKADRESVLLLHNLIPDGYKNEDRYVGFDLNTSKALLRILATFHATPLIIKFKKPELFKLLEEFLKRDNHPHPPPPKDGKHKHPPDHLLVDKMLEIPACQPYRAKLEALKERPAGPPMIHKPGKEPWNTIAHNDFWVNNVMLKVREGKEPLLKLLDFQFCSYSSYAKDLVFFLLSSVQNDIQKQYFDELLRHYYDQLTSIIEQFDIPELKLSYEDYLEEVKRVANESEFFHAVFFSTVIFGAKGTGPDLLMGEGDMFDHFEDMINNINDTHKNKLGLITELAAEKEWF